MSDAIDKLNRKLEKFTSYQRNKGSAPTSRGTKSRGQEGQLPSLPFNILKTQGQIVLFKISITDKFFLVMLHN